jgi:hypothetical protein
VGTEAVIPLLGLPFLGCLILLVVLAVRGQGGLNTEGRVLGLGRKRIAAGYLGAMLVALIAAMWMMRGQLKWGLDSGNYPREAASAYAVELLLFYFISCGLMILFSLTFLALPALAVLRRLRVASIAGVVVAATLFGSILGLWWDGPILPIALTSGMVALSFSLAARLPRLTSQSVRANKSLERTE